MQNTLNNISNDAHDSQNAWRKQSLIDTKKEIQNMWNDALEKQASRQYIRRNDIKIL